MYILGISCYYHDAAAALLKDGVVVAAAEEERFTRKKHDTRFPINAINYCLKEAGITPDKLACVAFYEKPMLKFERLLNQHFQMFPKSLPVFLRSTPSWLTEKLKLPSTLRKKLKYEGEVLFVEHHKSHAASSFLPSPFKKAAILTIDGVGEWATTTLGIGEGNGIKLMKEIHFPHSIGLLYSAVTAYLGFKVNNDEYKVMGLAAYGEPVYYDIFKKILELKDDGSYRLDMSYFVYHYKDTMLGKKFLKEFGPVRKPESKVEKRHKDIAASLQKITEEAVIKMLNHLHEITKCENVCIAGGVALNSLANGKLLRNTPFSRMYIQPAAGDAGGAIGAALYVYNTLLGKERNYVMDSAYLGPAFTDSEVKEFLDSTGIKYTEFSNDSELVKKTAQLIHSNRVVGWFQGRMEWGPRALGSRSILSNPCNPQMKDILNAKVKHREMFRPFAPAVAEEDAKDYFESDEPVPMPTDFMLMVYPIHKNRQKSIPSVVHNDGTGRLQTVRKWQNPKYYGVIKEFEKLSGVPVIINTSFNIRGEPIVCTPHEAYRCMMGTGIDYLVMGKYMISREDNPRDMWDSEKLAKD
jgi:carbamoyltransferase